MKPLQPADGSARLLLLNSGHQDYREFLAMLRWKASERTTMFASYVHSRAYGDLNDYNRFFGNFPYPLIRANQYGPLSSDAPDRGLFWDVIGLPHKLDFIPILDVHTGFPFSRVDQNWNYIGPENRRRTLSNVSGPRHQAPIPGRLHLSRPPHPVPGRTERLQRPQPLQPARRPGKLRLAELRHVL